MDGTPKNWFPLGFNKEGGAMIDAAPPFMHSHVS